MIRALLLAALLLLPLALHAETAAEYEAAIEEALMLEDVGETIHVHEKKAGLPQFDPSSFASQIFWLFVTFCVLYVYFAKAALPRISSTLEKRQGKIAQDLKDAKTLSAQANNLKTDYENAMNEAHLQAQSMINATEQEVKTLYQSVIDDATEKSNQAILETEQKIEQAKRAIQSDLNATIIDVAALMASKIASDIDVKPSELEGRFQTLWQKDFLASDKPRNSIRKKAA